MFKKIAVWVLYLIGYEACALIVNKPIILPDLTLIFTYFIQQALSASFYIAFLSSITRVLVGSLLALIFAFISALMAHKLEWYRILIQPFLVLVKTLPNITYILLILIWLSREVSVSVIALLIVFPASYAQMISGLDNLSVDQKEVLDIYPESTKEIILKVYVPSLLPFIFEALILSLSLGFKVGIMAEILGQVQPGLGYLMYSAKMNFDIAELFALSIWMILWVVFVEKGIRVWKTKHLDDLY